MKAWGLEQKPRPKLEPPRPLCVWDPDMYFEEVKRGRRLSTPRSGASAPLTVALHGVPQLG